MSKKNSATLVNEDYNSIEECFIITPIGALGSETYNKAMGLIDAVIDPVLSECGMRAVPANRMEDLGSINKQLIRRVIEDRLVIANLTGLNPNVMYELAIRHGARKPVIIMAEEGTRLPFDITDQRTIFYSDTLSGVEAAKKELRKKINFALNDKEPDNPIYSYLESAKLFQEIKDSDPLKQILEKFEILSSKINSQSLLPLKSRSSEDINSSQKDSVQTFKISGTYDISKLNQKEILQVTNIITDIGSIISAYLVNYSFEEVRLRSIRYIGDGKFVATIDCNSFSIFNNVLKDLSNISSLSNVKQSI